MKSIVKTLTVLALATTFAGNALAHGGWGPPPPYYRPMPPRYEHHHDHGRNNWVGPAIALGLVGLAVGVAASQPSAPAPRAYVAAPVPPAPTAIYAAPAVAVSPQYFCRSVGQYYPYTQYCPEGWQLVYPGN